MSSLGRSDMGSVSREPADVDESVEAARAAVRSHPGDGPGAAAYLTQLATALMDRFEHLGERADLGEAVDAARCDVAR
jgi:hypothetical protein